MNLPRVAIAAVVAWVVYLGVSFLVHTVLLEDLYKQHLGAMRPDADQAAILPVGFVFALVVAPEAWGSDAANLLMAEARRISPGGLDLKVNADNARAIHFYKKQGFVDAGETVNEISGAPVRMMRWRP